MPINLGATAISNLKLGATQVDKVYLGTNLVWSSAPPPLRAIKFSSPVNQQVQVLGSALGTISPNFEYSTDGGTTWTTWADVTSALSFGNGTDLYLRGSNTLLAQGTTNRTQFIFNGFNGSNYVDCTGNIMHLFDYTQDLTSFPSLSTSAGIRQMFSGVDCLRTAPDLPATDLPGSAYYRLFYSCTALQNCPALPATTLSGSCYQDMFRSCSALQSISRLPATTLANYCYTSMFRSCSNIKMSLTQDATYTNEYVFGTAPDSVNAANMFTATGGSFVGAPTQTTYYTANTIIG